MKIEIFCKEEIIFVENSLRDEGLRRRKAKRLPQMASIGFAKRSLKNRKQFSPYSAELELLLYKKSLRDGGSGEESAQRLPPDGEHWLCQAQPKKQEAIFAVLGGNCWR